MDSQYSGASNATVRLSRFEIVNVRMSITAATTSSAARPTSRISVKAPLNMAATTRRRAFRIRNRRQMTQFDILIVGGGIAGASLGAEVAAKRRALIIE